MKKWLFQVLLLLVSCERLWVEPDIPSTDTEANFQVLWNTFDRKYSLFNFKQVDWKEVYGRYRPKVHPGMPDEELFKIMAAMLSELKDGHVGLRSPFSRSDYDYTAGFPANFNRQLLEENYLKGEQENTGPFIHRRMGNAGYIRLGGFGTTLTDNQLDEMLGQYSDTKGIILDIRNNNGGNDFNATLLASRFADQRRLVEYNRQKTGPAHEAFSQPAGKYLSPAGEVRYTNRVILLTNRGTFSAANSFTSMMKAFPQVITLGDTTGGGASSPIYHELPNGWRYQLPSDQVLNPQLQIIENGVPPNIPVTLTPEDEARGVDTILERALREIGN